MDMDAETMAKLKAMGLYSDSQEKALKEERRKKDQEREKKSKNKFHALESHVGYNQSGQGGGQKSGAPIHREISLKGKKYGFTKNAEVDVKPPEIATAPYNFVPLPGGILPSRLDAMLSGILTDGDGRPKASLTGDERKEVEKSFGEYLTTGEHYSGTIKLDIENLTPLFIGGNGELPFAPTGRPIIPGSELRGMTKNLFKMITCGALRAGEDFADHHLYYRSLMAPRSAPFNQGLHELYTNKMTGADENGKAVKLAKPGFLVKRGRKYSIYPLLPKKLHSIVIREYMGKFHAYDREIKNSAVRWDKGTAYVQVGIKNARKLLDKEGIEDFFKRTPKKLRNKIGKQYYRYFSVSDIDKSEPLEVKDDVIEEYKSDKNRHGVDLIKLNRVVGTAPRSIEGIPPFDAIAPCFYMVSDGLVSSFGHGQSYRIPYDKSIADAIPEELQKPTIDFSDAVFGYAGKTASWASRVAFDDAVMVKDAGSLPAGMPHPLMQPNPTSFQLYLKQDESDRLTHWDSLNAEIRGYKLYWHQPDGNGWQASENEKKNLSERDADSAELNHPIAPLKKGCQFTGQIRFQDLSSEELGALLKVFDIGDADRDIAYKIGMGKSIGLGSIHIKTTLRLEDEHRYTKLFDEDGFYDSLKDADEKPFIEAFERYVHDAVDGALDTSYGYTLKALQDMLDYSLTNTDGWREGTAPMNGDTKDAANNDTRFKNRNILPDEKGVIDKIKHGLK